MEEVLREYFDGNICFYADITAHTKKGLREHYNVMACRHQNHVSLLGGALGVAIQKDELTQVQIPFNSPGNLVLRTNEELYIIRKKTNLF